MWVTITVLVIGALTVLWGWSSYNQFVGLRNVCDQAWSNVEVELKRRWDLIENLVQVVKGYAKHEANTLINVIQARRDATGNAPEANAAEREAKGALGKLIMLSEAYPNLKADKNFLELQTELVTTENRIAERRSAYNQTVNMYRNLYYAFPANLIAALGGFTERVFYDAPDEVEAVPDLEHSFDE